jgi:hypothetical protein
VLKSAIFYIIGIICIFSLVGNMIINGNYKTYVKNSINDDKYLTFIGMIGSLGNGGGRFVWSIIFKFLGYRRTVGVVMTINILLFVFIHYTISNK